MSSGQERSSGPPPESQPMQPMQSDSGASSTGMTTGARATGTTTADTGTTTETYGRHAAQEPTPAGYDYGYRPETVDYGASDGVLGGTFMVIAGLVTFFTGLTAVVRTSYFHSVRSSYPYAWTIYDWGWAILILGVVMFAIGVCAALGMGWAKPVGVGLSILTVIAGFMFLVYFPIWGLLLLALSLLAIWGLLRHAAT
jgi:hypothetical protein